MAIAAVSSAGCLSRRLERIAAALKSSHLGMRASPRALGNHLAKAFCRLQPLGCVLWWSSYLLRWSSFVLVLPSLAADSPRGAEGKEKDTRRGRANLPPAV